MELEAKSESVLRKYLLGSVSSEEQEELELWLMSDQNACDLLEAAEDDLIDDALAGRLEKSDLDLFNSHFMAAPERQRKLQFGRSLKRVLNANLKPAPIPSHAPRAALTWLGLRQPAVAYASIALTVLLLIGTGWSLFKVVKLQQALRSTTDQLANAGRDRDDLKRQLDQSQNATRTLEDLVRGLEAAVGGGGAGKSAEFPVLLAVNLMAGITRSSSDVPKISVVAETRVIRFTLVLLDDNFTAYRASLRNAEDRELLSRDKLAATPARNGKAVVLTVPAEIISNGDYSFSLLGIPVSGNPESAGRYSFRAVRQ